MLDQAEVEQLAELIESSPCPLRAGEGPDADHAHRWVRVGMRHVESCAGVVEVDICGCGRSRARFHRLEIPPAPEVVYVSNASTGVVHVARNVYTSSARAACGAEFRTHNPLFQLRACAQPGPYSHFLPCTRCARLSDTARAAAREGAALAYSSLRQAAARYSQQLADISDGRLADTISAALTLSATIPTGEFVGEASGGGFVVGGQRCGREATS